MVGHTWVTSCIVGVCWTAGVMSASTVGAPPAHRRVHILVLDAQTQGGSLSQDFYGELAHCLIRQQSATSCGRAASGSRGAVRVCLLPGRMPRR